MAAHLTIGLSKAHHVAVVGLRPSTSSVLERRIAEADIFQWHLGKREGFDPRMFSSLRRVLREFQPQIIHTHMAVQRYVFPLLFRNRVAGAFHTMHSLAKYETDAFGRLVHWFAFRSRVQPVAVSREVSASVERVYGLGCKAVIPNCIPVEGYQASSACRLQWREQERIEGDAIVFTCVGRLEHPKNPLLLLQAFARLSGARVHLVFLGDGSLREKLAAYAQSNNLRGRVHFLGKRDDVPSVLAASDVFVLASDWEGNPLAVMEAMAAGLPVIATEVGGVPELVRSGEHGLLVRAGDCAAFAHAMQSLHDDQGTRLIMAGAARKRAMREFRLERMVQGYSDLYRDAVTTFQKTQSKTWRSWAPIPVKIPSEQSK